MRWTFDSDAAAMYVYLTDREIDAQIELGEGIIVDVAEDGSPVGVELLSPHPTDKLNRLLQLGIDKPELDMIIQIARSPFPVAAGGAVEPGEFVLAGPSERVASDGYELDFALAP